MKTERRIRILPENEIDDLFERPVFNDEERLIWFELTEEERLLLAPKKTLEGKIDLMLQIGYFKAKQQFFTYLFEDVPEDVSYILARYFPGRVLEKSKIGRETKRLNQCSMVYALTEFN